MSLVVRCDWQDCDEEVELSPWYDPTASVAKIIDLGWAVDDVDVLGERTPVFLAADTPPATLADVDLEALRDAMAASIEKAAADDPVALRRRIVELEKAVGAKSAQAEPCGHGAFPVTVRVYDLEAPP